MDIKELEKIMVEHGLVIRVIPQKVRSILEKQHVDKFPDGKIEYLEKYKREMLVVEETPKNAGKFVIECVKHNYADVHFAGKNFYGSIEEAVEDFLKNNEARV